MGFEDGNADFHRTRLVGVPVLGGGDHLVHLAQELEVDEVILAITHRHAINQRLFDALLRCRELGYRVTTMSMLYERLVGRVAVDHVGRDLHAVLPMDNTQGERLYRAVKRGGDFLLALCSLARVAVMAPLVALVNAFTSPGSLFYRQERVGRGGGTSHMLKFRTMAPNADPDGHAVWASYRDQLWCH